MAFAPGPIDTRPAASRLDPFIECLLIALLITLPAVRGAVNAWGEMIAISIGAIIAALLAVRRTIVVERSAGGWIIWTPIVLFILLAVAQLIPLPATALRIIAPGTHALKSELLSDLPAALSRMTISFYPLGTRYDLRIVLLAITVFATVLTVYRDQRRARRLLIAITLIGAASAILALAQYAARTDEIFFLIDIGMRARSGPFVNHSHYGQFMNLSIAAALALLLMQPRRWSHALPLAAFIGLGWATIALSGTRGGMISAAVAGAVVLISVASAWRARWLMAIALAVLAGAAVAMERFGTAGRLEIARDVWQMQEQLGRTGAGLGTFELAFTMFDRGGTANITAHADNEYVHILAEMGWPGVVVVLCFVAAIWWRWWRAVRGGDRAKSSIVIGAGYGLVAVMIHSLSDFGQHIPANACLSAIMCGIIVNLSADVAAHPRPARRAGRVLAALVIIAIAGWAVIEAERARRGEAYWAEASDLVDELADANWTGSQHDVDHLRAALDGAVAAEPGNVKYRYRRALYTWRIAARQFNRGSPELTSAARAVVDELNAARRACPTYGPVYSVLGQIEHSHLGLSIGLSRLETAIRLEPNDPIVWFAAGRADARRGNYQSANRKFRRALKLDYLVMNDIAEMYLDELGAPQPAIDLVEGNYYQLRQLGNAMIARPRYHELGNRTYIHGSELMAEKAKRERSTELLGAAGGAFVDIGKLSEADELLRDALRQDPSRTDFRLAHARALLRLNRLDEAAQELQIAERQQPDAPELASLKEQLQAARQKSQ